MKRRLVLLAVLAGLLSACGGGGSHTKTSSQTTASSHASTSSHTTTSSTPALSGTAAQRTRTQFAARTVTTLSQVVAGMVASGQYRDGVFHLSTGCFRCGIEMGTVAAILNAWKPGKGYGQIAIKTFDTFLAQHLLPTGAIGPPANGDQISTAAAVVSLGTAYLELAPSLPAAVKTQWSNAITAAANWLRVPKRLLFYINGNVNIQQTLAMYIAWRVTGNIHFLGAYRQSLAFTLDPGPAHPGFGLQISKVGKQPLDADSAGYLAEQGAGAPGFDPHYTVIQADYTGELYALSHSREVLKLLNLFVNQLLTRATPGTLVIVNERGSRHPDSSSQGLLISCAVPILAFANRSHDLLRYVLPELSTVSINFVNYVKADNDQDQQIGNFAMALLALPPPPSKQ